LAGCSSEIIALNGLSAPFPVFVPFQVVAAFRMMFIAAVYPDVIADDSPVALYNPGEPPFAVHLDHLDDVDSFGILLGSGHRPESSMRSALDK
jgi:hypothetical protein